MAAMEARLFDQGWYISAKGIEKCRANPDSNANEDVKDIIQKALNFDLKDIGASVIPDDLSRFRKELKLADCVLQVSSVTNVSAPKSNQESNASPRLLRIELTDGHSKISALSLGTLKNFSLKTPPGTKLRLKLTKIPFQHGFFILSDQHVDVIGGTVEALVEKWKLEEAHANYTRSIGKVGGDGGPPKWVPFGHRGATSGVQEITGKFKSLDPTGSKEKESKDDDTFEQQRKATIAEATKSSRKVFGGKKEIIDRDDGVRVPRARDDRSRSSKTQFAVNATTDGGSFSERPNKFEKRGRGGSRGGRRERDRGGDGHDLLVSTAPSRPSTLFDFLESKIPNISNSTSSDQVATASTNNQSSNYKTNYGGKGNSREQYSNDDHSNRYKGSGDNFRRPFDSAANSRPARGPTTNHSRSSNVSFAARSSRFPQSNSALNSSAASANDFTHRSSSSRPSNNNYISGSNKATYGQSASRKDQPSSQRSSAGSRDNEFVATAVTAKSYNPPAKKPSDLKDSRPSLTFKPGDPCVAKYWEDNKFYQAVIHAVAPSGSTCVVLFPQYGNYEEVLLKDVQTSSNYSQALSANRGRGSHHASATASGDQEFCRRRTGPQSTVQDHHQQQQDGSRPHQQAFSRPTRQAYLPPAQRH